MKNVFLLLIVFCFYCCKSQNIDHNLDFEIVQKKQSIPEGWFVWGDVIAKSDSIVYQSGKRSVSIFESGGEEFGSIAHKIENRYKGKEITLEGYIKTENLENGFAGLFLRINEGENILEFNNMQLQNIHGTNDWKKYTITVPFHNNADYIYIGAIVQGKGKAWFDNFKIYIDGVEISKVPFSKKDKNEETESGFTAKNISETEISNLYKLGQKWSYLKYHSPIVSMGKTDWDKELFKLLPYIYDKNFDKKLADWAHSFEKKEEIKENFYVEFYPEEGHPIFKNEASYSNMKWNDDGLKILALFRYWGTIEYFYPYKHLIPGKWDQILYQYIPKFINCKDELSYKLSVLELTSEIHDSHAAIYNFGNVIEEFYGINKAPINVKFIEGKLVVTGNNSAQDISIGDIITEIDHKKVEEIVKERTKYEQASNQNGLLRNISFNILRTNHNFLSLKIKKDKLASELDVDVRCIPIYNSEYTEKQPSHKLLTSQIGYINAGFLVENEIDSIMEKYINKKGIVVDLRNYPSDFFAYSLSKYLIASPTNFAKFTTTSFKNLGTFTPQKMMTVGENYKTHFNGKVVILVDEMTQSSAEFIAMALSAAPKSTVMGSQTAGADGNISKITLPGNLQTSITGIGILYPKDKETQRTGISINIPVKPTIKGVRTGKDEILQKAIEYITQ
nr:S41 family peptidase [uncultured Chryseobacterium sp.]